MVDMWDLHAFEDLEIMERYERRRPYIPPVRNNDLIELDEIDFKKRYRFHKQTIKEVVNLLRSDVSSETDRNHAITAEEKVLAAMRYFAFGSEQLNIGDLHRISQPSASRIISEVAESLAKLRPRYIYLPGTEAERMEISQKFYHNFGFPCVYGALDCTLIKILSPGGERPEAFRCRKGFFALNIQTLSDSDLFIRNIVTRWPGSAHDSTVFDQSYLRAHLETEVPQKYHVLGDSGYPLRSYLLTPFLNPVNASQIRYNAVHASARNVVERQYGVWKKRFACLSTPFRCKLETVPKIIVATAVLHNLALTLGDAYDNDEKIDEDSNDTISDSQSIAGIAKRNYIVSNFFNQ